MNANMNGMGLRERRLEAELIRTSINMKPSAADFNSNVEYILKEKVALEPELTGIFAQIRDNRAEIPLKLLVAKADHSYIPQIMDEIMFDCGYKHDSPEVVGAQTLLRNYSGLSPKQVDKQLSFYLDRNFMD